ncbi:hypothetical protein [Erwinia pyrifoliae]|uniref:hypothetical protein n=1 Tax=Erwinia pyrifoliae TaxID=79967 RepID=UPI00223AD447|nr:hypothetical protein [Erwinia pyrifoliae]MCT2386406.1 hypothetical protein [Erwinia pyrifoliae]MCU8587997.1 hypothetical protein [Erwinia pyrifoliae]
MKEKISQSAKKKVINSHIQINMPPLNPTAGSSSAHKTPESPYRSNLEEQDIWFDATGYVEMDETFFDACACDSHHAAPVSAGDASASRIPFTEDSRRALIEFVLTIRECAESHFFFACIRLILPGVPSVLVAAVKSLYDAFTGQGNMGKAALYASAVASEYLHDKTDIVNQLAAFIWDTFDGWTHGTFLQQFLGGKESRISTCVCNLLAITAIVIGRRMKNEGAPQRGWLKVPTFVAHIFIHVNFYMSVIKNMASRLPPSGETSQISELLEKMPAFEVDTSLEMTEDVCDAAFSCPPLSPRITAYSSNSTAIPEACSRGAVHNKPISAPGQSDVFTIPDQIHFRAVEKLRQKSELSAVAYCVSRKTETRQQTNGKVVTDTHINTKCDATVYPESLRKPAENTHVHTEKPETQVFSPATSRSGGEALLPLVMTAAALPNLYVQSVKSKTVIAATGMAGLTGITMVGKLLWDKLPAHNAEEKPVNRIDNIENSPLKTRKENIRIKKILVNEGLLKKGEVVNKEKLLSAMAEYLFGNKNGIAGSADKIQKLARKILSADELYGGGNGDQLFTTQAKSVLRSWVFNNVMGMSPVEYIINNIKVGAYPGYYTISSIHHLLSMEKLLKEQHLHLREIPLSQWGELNAMWYSFLTEEMPFLKFTDESIKKLELKDHSFSHLYSGSRFLTLSSFNNYTAEEAMSTGEKMWELAVSEGVTIDNLACYRAPALFFTQSSLSAKRMQESNDDIDAINYYIQYRKEVREVQKDIKEKYNKYLFAAKAWLRKGKLADVIIAQCPALSAALPDLAEDISTPEQKRENAKYFAKQNYLNEIVKPCESAPESLSNEYRRLTADVSDSFREIDKYLIISAISSLPENESSFIQLPDASIHLATAYIQMREPGSTFVTHKHFVDRTDLFAVKQEVEERIYALKAERNNDNGYKLFRVDRDVKQYISGGIFGETFDDYKITWDKVEDSQDIANFAVKITEQALTGNDSHINTITSSLSKKHHDDLYNALYEAGNDKSDIQKIWGVVKHLIPFYDCVEDIVNNNLQQAVPTCLMDAVAFIPVFGEAASLSGKFGMGFARALRSGAVIAGREGIQVAGRNLLREVSLPTTAELTSLGKNALRAADPGFELMTGISRKFGNIIVKLLSADKEMAGLTKSIISAGILEKLPWPPSDEIVMGIIPKTQLSLPVKAIGRQADRNIYVQMNPETGALFGKKYFKEGSDKLINCITRKKGGGIHDNKVTGRVEWRLFNFKKLNKYEITPHRSGLYTTLDLQGEDTGELFLLYKRKGFSITELSQGEYYMMQGVRSRLIIKKEQLSGDFIVVNKNKNKNIENFKYLDDTWCSSRAGGRKLLVNPDVTCIGIPEVGGETINYRINVQLDGYEKSHEFDVRYRGLYGMDTSTRLDVKNKIDDALFYENNRMHLKQEYIDASAYESIFSDKDINISRGELVFSDHSDAGVVSHPALTKNEKLAVRRWTAVDDDLDEVFSDGMKDTTKMGMNPMNYDLNKKLATAEKLNEDERNMVRLFDSALNKIPSQKGDFIRVSEYTDFTTPWDSDLKPGDIVTNYPCYMSVSSDFTYINQETQAISDAVANVYLVLENTYSSKPLLKGSATFSDELESVFKRNSAFKIKQIAIADDVTSGSHALEVKKRIVVTLVEVDLPLSKIAKNIHTGKTVNVLM